MTARALWAGSGRRMAPSVQAAIGGSPDSDHRNVGPRSAAPDAPTPGFMRSVRLRMPILPATGAPTFCAMRSMRISSRAASRSFQPNPCRCIRPRVFRDPQRITSYRIINRRPPLAARSRAGLAGQAAGSMRRPCHAAAQILVGGPRFLELSATPTHARTKSPVRTLDRPQCGEDTATSSRFTQARGLFSHHQVRSMVGLAGTCRRRQMVEG